MYVYIKIISAYIQYKQSYLFFFKMGTWNLHEELNHYMKSRESFKRKKINKIIYYQDSIHVTCPQISKYLLFSKINYKININYKL